MAIEYKDYYDILEIEPEAGLDQIRAAFRRLARAYHPDKTGNDRRAEERFKEINEAYEVLGDPLKRKRYDDFNTAWSSSYSAEDAWSQFGRSGPPGGRSEHFTFSDERGFSEFFDQLFGQREVPPANGGPRKNVRSRQEVRQQTTGRGEDLESDLTVTLEEVAEGATRPVSIRRLVRCSTCYGMGQYNAHPCERCDGKGNLVQADHYTVKVPKGIKENAFLRISGGGEEGLNKAPSGDLFLKIHYAKHPEFRVENGLLQHDLELAPWEAVLGGTITIPTLAGQATIKIPAGTQNGTKLRLRERGLPSEDATTRDMIVNIKIQVPISAANRERQLWEELARSSEFNPRAN